MRIIVTGATGYLGSKIIDNLTKDGSVNIISLQRRKLSNCIEQKFELVATEISHIKEYLDKNDLKVDLILYMACQYDKGTNINNVFEVNLTLPLELLSLAKEYSVGKYVYIGTALPEEVNSYSFTKQTLAKCGKIYTDKEKLDFINIELESFYSADEPNDRFIKKSILELLGNRDISLTEGKQKRDYIHVDEVVQNICKIVYSKNLKGFHEIPIGTGTTPTIREIIEYLKEITNSKSNLLFGVIPSRKFEPDCVADVKKMEEYGIIHANDWKSGFDKVVEELK